VLEVIVRRANLQTTGRIYNKETQRLAYANDIDIDRRSQSAVRNAYLALQGEAAKEGLKVNEQKTKYMIAGDICQSRKPSKGPIHLTADCANMITLIKIITKMIALKTYKIKSSPKKSAGKGPNNGFLYIGTIDFEGFNFKELAGPFKNPRQITVYFTNTFKKHFLRPAMINLQIVSIQVVFRKLQNLNHVINKHIKTEWRYTRSLRNNFCICLFANGLKSN
jgi:hypothetical protein